MILIIYVTFYIYFQGVVGYNYPESCSPRNTLQKCIWLM